MTYKFKTRFETESMSLQIRNISFGNFWYVEHKIEGKYEEGFDILVTVCKNGLLRAKKALSQYRGVRFVICP